MTSPAEQERAAVVAWLRGLHWTHCDKIAADRFAIAIERTEHLRGGE